MFHVQIIAFAMTKKSGGRGFESRRGRCRFEPLGSSAEELSEKVIRELEELRSLLRKV